MILTHVYVLLATGMALHAQGSVTKTNEALDVLSSAAERDPNNPQVLQCMYCTIYLSVQ